MACSGSYSVLFGHSVNNCPARPSSQQRLMAALIRANAEPSMCNKCDEIDQKIEHYRSIVSRLTDQLTNERIAELIADLEKQKAGLHPEQKK
jgi:hypothetical protein